MAGLIDGKSDEKRREEKGRQQQEQQARMREATEEGGDATSSVDEIDLAFHQADAQLEEWQQNPVSIQDDSLNAFIEFWLEKAKEYGQAHYEYSDNFSVENNEASQRDLEYFNKSHEILATANRLKETHHVMLAFENKGLSNGVEATHLPDQAGLAAAARNQAPARARAEDNGRVRNANDDFLGRWFRRMPSLTQVALGAAVSFLSYRMNEKHIPEFLSRYCAPYSGSVASWHLCYGFPKQEELNQLDAFKRQISFYFPQGFPLVHSLIANTDLNLTMYYGDAVRRVDCGEGKTACYAFLPRDAELIAFSQGVNCAIYNTSCYESRGNNSEALKYYQELEPMLQQQEKKFSALTFNPPNGAGYYAIRAGNDFSKTIENIKNLYAAARLTASARKEATLAFIARQMRTTLTHDYADRLPDGAVVIRGRSPEIRAALHGERIQYDQAVNSWAKAREAYQHGLAAAPRYEKEEWFSKEDWRHYLQDLTYRTVELQYWQSHTLQRILEDDLRRMNQLGSKNLSDPNSLHSKNEATHSLFSETIRECYQLADTITRLDASSPYRMGPMRIRTVAGQSRIIQGAQVHELIAQRVKLLCDTFQEDLQKNDKKNQLAIESIKIGKQGSKNSQAF